MQLADDRLDRFCAAHACAQHIYAQRLRSIRHLLAMFCSSAVLDPTVGHTMDVTLYLPSVILTDSSTGSPVHVLMLSTQAVRGFPRPRAPDIVPCIISFSRQLPCFLMV